MSRSALMLMVLLLTACGGTDRLGESSSDGPTDDDRAPEAAADADDVVRCADVEKIAAPEGRYRDEPVYTGNEMPADAVEQWAHKQSGFEQLWIDRDRDGWITVAFSEDAGARQDDLERRFPDDGVVAVGVDWTMDELEDVQARVMDELSGRFEVSSYIDVTKGVVGVGVGVLKEERVAAVAEFADQPICVDGQEPEDAPAEGPQPRGGDGWRLLADEQDTGAVYETGVATDEDQYARLWDDTIGLSDTRAGVDFEEEVVVWFGAVYGSSCPELRLDDVIVDRERDLVYADVVLVDPPSACTEDANSHAYVVALDRDRLPEGPFAIQLDADDPPGGAPGERTLIDADLSEPGATASDAEIGDDPQLFEREQG